VGCMYGGGGRICFYYLVLVLVCFAIGMYFVFRAFICSQIITAF
jgi:hypothetical protein